MGDWELRQLIHAHKDNKFQKLLENFGKIIAFKKDVDYDHMLAKEFPLEEDFQRLNPCCVCGVDKYGHPVLWEKLNKTKLKILKSDYKWDNFLMYRHRIMKQIRDAKLYLSGCLEHEIHLHTVVVDLDGISLSQAKRLFTDPKLKSILNFSELYPGCIFKTIIINTNFWIKSFYHATSEPSDQVELFGYDYHDYLRSLIPEKWILEEYGGSGRFDPRCVVLPSFKKNISIKNDATKIKEEEQMERQCEEEEIDRMRRQQFTELISTSAILSLNLQPVQADDEEYEHMLTEGGCNLC